MKTIFTHGFIAGILAALMSILYQNLYQSTLEVSFDVLINFGGIIGSSIFGCTLMSVGYIILFKYQKQQWLGLVNMLIVILSFASIMGPIAMTLPLEIEFPELLPGLAIPMHFFPALSFFALAPFFKGNKI